MITYKTQDLQLRHKLIALDLGYSRNKRTCGIMYDGLYQPIKLTFGNAINSVSDWIDRNGSCVLVIEAVLSTFHNAAGNPDIRGDFEKGRGWYYGPGVATFAAAIRLLRVLHRQVAGNVSVYLAEAFLSFKKGRSNHSKDAMVIYNQFWDTDPEEIKDGTEPILECISGVPSVRVFGEK